MIFFFLKLLLLPLLAGTISYFLERKALTYPKGTPGYILLAALYSTAMLAVVFSFFYIKAIGLSFFFGYLWFAIPVLFVSCHFFGAILAEYRHKLA